MTAAAWQVRELSHDLRIGEGETHVWLLSCVLDEDVRGAFWDTLDARQRERAARFRFDADRERYVARSGALRRLLSGYVGVAPERLAFAAGAHGKPYLENPGGADIDFNASSSGDWAMVAVTRGRPVGIDIERIDAARSDPALVAQFFAPGERQRLGRLDGQRWIDGFFNCWVRKEAFIKATGEGLSRALDDFEVSLEPGEPACLLRAGDDPREASRWQMATLDPVDGYAHALAVAGEVGELTGLMWQSQAAREKANKEVTG